MGRVHASAAGRNGARVMLVADASRERAEAMAREVGAKAVSINEMCASGTLDVIHVCTPPSEHVEVVSRLLESGVHVLCEKPLAPSAADVERLHDIADIAGVRLCPSHQFPFQRGVQRFVMARESLGNVHHLAAEICTAGAEAGNLVARSQVLADILPHPLSLTLAFGAQRLSDVEWKVIEPLPGELVIGGVSGSIGISLLLSTRGRPTTNSVRVISDRGTVTLDLFHGYSIFERSAVSRMGKLTRPFAGSGLTLANATANGLRRAIDGETSFPGLRELVRRFYASISLGEPQPVNREESVDIARARDAIIAWTSLSS